MAEDLTPQLRRIIDRTGVKVEDAILDFSQRIAEEAIKLTPVDTGFLRASWYTSIGTPAGNGVPSAKSPKGTPPSPVILASMQMTLMNASAGDTVYIMNGAKYAAQVEYGTSGRPGRRFVGRTVAKAGFIANQLIAEYRVR